MNDTFHGIPPSSEGNQIQVLVRKALPADADTILELVRGLAEYEKLPPPDDDAQGRLVRDMFSTPPRINALLAEVAGAPAGYAFYFETYSSFLARPTLYLEDIFVRTEFRGRGAGIALFGFLAREALARDCGRMEWVVLDWNQPAIDFYGKLGARHMKEWQIHRLGREELMSLLGGTNRAF